MNSTKKLALAITAFLLTIFYSANCVAQIYYVSDDTLWVQTTGDAEPEAIADGSSLPVYGVVADQEGGYVYWTQDAAFGSEIFRASLNSLKQEKINEESESARGIALDIDNEKMYWADLSNDGAIYRANLDGTEAEIILAGESDGATNGILDLDLDLENQKVYWVKQGGVMRANMDGSGVETVVEINSFVQPTAIVLDISSEFVYWTDTSTDKIMRASFDGSSKGSVVEVESPAALDIDAAGSKLYWVEDYLFSGGGGAIYRSNLDGSEVELVKETSFTRNALFVVEITIPTSNEREQLHSNPAKVSLKSNYPNPFNPQTVIEYQLTEAMSVTLNVYNFLGQKVQSLVQDEMQTSGSHHIVFDANTLPSGMYFYRIRTRAGSITKQMTLIK